ncbi:serine hydrolase [Roseisolibacter sp. H3M3-2]|uniref:serine hydrolase domain-containing protein n=1 Tax=Roseisolibacter sp. H3M3-2 TaxID=3031323 RepID=UPI0023DA4564|nr:serine hydrolase [Roseisolibacter sp. H3M3-2]MDF1503059.1 serine hydrolase [Roseisolibacter sp. H3M3-2]
MPASRRHPLLRSLVLGAGVSLVCVPAPRVAGAMAADDPVAVRLPRARPAAVGMSAERLAVLDRVVARGIAEGGYPGAALIVGRRGRAVWQRGYGTLAWEGGRRVSAESTLYDLASLTKVVGTTSAVMALVDDRRLDLDAPVRRYLPAFTGAGREGVTVRQLLEHRSGLAAGAALWRNPTPEAALLQVLHSPLRGRPGRTVEYSDLGMIVLGRVVEVAAREPMDVYLQRRVFGPLGMRQTSFRPALAHDGAARLARLAPTGVAAADGRVHDGNAAALGGVAGHAGLFGTAADLAVYAQTLLGGGVGPNGVRVFAESTVRRFLRRAPGETRRALGWETCGTDRDDVCGRLLDERAVMHTGFTGTFLVIDPTRQAFAVLLTNRVHAPRVARPARVIRDVRADVADALALAVVDGAGGPLPMPVALRADLNVAAWRAPAVRVASR